MAKKIFLSYVFEDRMYRDQVKDWARRGLLGNIEIIAESEDKRQDGIIAIKEHLRPIMRSADAALVLVGQDTHDRRWIDEEVRYMIGSGKPVIPVRIPNTTGAPPPDIRSTPLSIFSPTELKQYISSVLNTDS